MKSTLGNRQAGFSMMEILITMVVMAIGLMGMASLQYVSLKNVNSSYYRYQAALLAYDMAERMRANPGGVGDGDYNALSVDGTEQPASCTTSCSVSATQDKNEWGQSLAAAKLPGATASVSASGGGFDIVVNWQEQNTGANIGTAQGTPETKSYTLSVEF